MTISNNNQLMIIINNNNKSMPLPNKGGAAYEGLGAADAALPHGLALAACQPQRDLLRHFRLRPRNFQIKPESLSFSRIFSSFSRKTFCPFLGKSQSLSIFMLFEALVLCLK